jgi:hypothetical protein
VTWQCGADLHVNPRHCDCDLGPWNDLGSASENQAMKIMHLEPQEPLQTKTLDKMLYL